MHEQGYIKKFFLFLIAFFSPKKKVYEDNLKTLLVKRKTYFKDT